VLTPSRLPLLVLAALFTALGCHAQSAPSTELKNGDTVSPALAHRIEVLLRGKVELPPASTITVGPVQPSDVTGYHTVTVSFTAQDNSSHPVNFLLSDDGKTVAQFIKYDISADPRTVVADDGRPSRGGPTSAPVVLVNFDDLECPFCGRLHTSLFPTITQRYGDKVHIVYKDFPLTEIHPWSMHASVDVNCLADQSPTGYWNLVDYIHGHSEDIGTDPAAKPDPAKPDAPKHTLDRAYTQLDKLTRDQGVAQKVDAAKLDTCIAKQDTAAIDLSRKLGESLNVGSTPTFYINGAKYDGAIPVEFIFAQIDNALRAEGVTPPPPYAAPAAPAAPNLSPTK
jgi:protein-disulfide isomerase